MYKVSTYRHKGVRIRVVPLYLGHMKLVSVWMCMHVLVVFMAIISTLEYMYVVGKGDRK